MFGKPTKDDAELLAAQREAEKQLALLPETLLEKAMRLSIPEDVRPAWMEAEAKSISDYYDSLDAGFSDHEARALAWPEKAALGGAGDGAAAPQVEAAPEPATITKPDDGKIGLISTLQSVVYSGKREGKPYSVTLKGHPHGFENRVTQEQLEFLEAEQTFKTHRDNGFITRAP